MKLSRFLDITRDAVHLGIASNSNTLSFTTIYNVSLELHTDMNDALIYCNVERCDAFNIEENPYVSCYTKYENGCLPSAEDDILHIESFSNETKLYINKDNQLLIYGNSETRNDFFSNRQCYVESLLENFDGVCGQKTMDYLSEIAFYYRLSVFTYYIGTISNTDYVVNLITNIEKSGDPRPVQSINCGLLIGNTSFGHFLTIGTEVIISIRNFIINDASVALRTTAKQEVDGYVHSGWAYEALSLLTYFNASVSHFILAPSIERVTFTGHGTGAAIAQLMHYYSFNYEWKSKTHGVYFGAARAGDIQFQSAYQNMFFGNVLFFKHRNDPVTMVPLYFDTPLDVLNPIEFAPFEYMIWQGDNVGEDRCSTQVCYQGMCIGLNAHRYS